MCSGWLTAPVRLCGFALVLAGFLACDRAAVAQDIEALPDDETGTVEIDDDGVTESVLGEETELLGVPLPIVDPTLGEGVALAGLATFQANEDKSAPRSTLALVVAGTNTDSWLVGAGGKAYLDEDRYRVSFAAGYTSLNLEYYGTSSDSVFFKHPVGFNVEGALATAEGQVRVREDLFVGLAFRYLRPSVSLDSNIDPLDSLTLTADLSAPGATIEYDTRDNPNSPSSGNLIAFDAFFYDRAFGSDFDFQTLDAFWSHYMELDDALVLAGQLRAAQTTGNAPFFMLPFINFRGFPAGQYLGESVAQGQAELRWNIWERIGAVAFGGIGSVMADAWQPHTASRGYGAGLGVRYEISEVDRLNVGLDVAYGSTGDVTYYFRIGEAF
jgi:outer membrane protein assembly factor BamA